MKSIDPRRVVRIVRNIILFLAFIGLTVAPDPAQTTPASSVTTRVVVVSIPDRKLALVEDGKIVRVYPVAVGATVSPSPIGEFEIVDRLTNPTYYRPHVVIPARANSPIGTRWVGLNRKGYGIHGTNDPRSIGRATSHGCIRMRNRDIAQLFARIRVGDRVEIHGERNLLTAAVFGSGTEVVTQAPATAEIAMGQ